MAKIYESPDKGKTITEREINQTPSLGWQYVNESEFDKVMAKDPKKTWILEVEKVHEEYFISFPDDLLNAANLKEGDNIEWIDNGDGSFILKKLNPMTYDEMIAEGWTMTDDGFWIKDK
jgi:bifunctional DNA-binding transcriptional regulator/antitoxin component of YhaV-PrlF toxin-antitoxin module